jgi:histone arginine demethylase JMJD6
VDCSVCKDVDVIDDVSVKSLSVEHFEEKYAHSNRPLVVRNASLTWKAMNVLDYSWLRRVYLSDPQILKEEDEDCWFNQYKTKEFRHLRSVFKMLGPTGALKSAKPWYVGWSVCHDKVATKLAKLYKTPSFINLESIDMKMPWIFLGTPGPGAHFHIDNVDLPSWQAQLSGIKTWYLKPPPECYWSCHGVMQTTLYPGDILVLNTNIWSHSTMIHGSDLSIVITSEFD